MSNANLTLLTTANSFLQQMIDVNNLANDRNTLRNGEYVKDNGDFFIANGVLYITSTTGTVLQVSANASIAGTLTVNTIIGTGSASILGATFLFSNPNGIATFANAVYATSVFANNLFVSGNAIIQGTTTVDSDEIILRALQNTGGDGFFDVNRGTGQINASIKWSETAKDYELLNVASNIYYTILTTQNLSAFAPTLAGWTETVNTIGTINSPNTIICNLAANNVFDITLGNSAFGFINIAFVSAAVPGVAQPITLILRQSSNNANLVNFSNTIHWSGNSTPILSTGINNLDVLSLLTVDGGATFLGATSSSGASSGGVNAAANTVEVSANGGSILSRHSLNFVNTATVTVAVTDKGDGNANIAFSRPMNMVTVTGVVVSNGQQNFNMNVVPQNEDYVLVIVNGLTLTPRVDYTVNANICTLNTGAYLNSVVTTRVFL